MDTNTHWYHGIVQYHTSSLSGTHTTTAVPDVCMLTCFWDMTNNLLSTKWNPKSIFRNFYTIEGWYLAVVGGSSHRAGPGEEGRCPEGSTPVGGTPEGVVAHSSPEGAAVGNNLAGVVEHSLELKG